jgi:ABC-2 type transport system permease protein
MQTVLAPIVTSLLFLAVFTLALGRRVENIQGIDFSQFLVPGLAMMAMVQNSFANTSSSMVISKVQGNIVDVLMPPMTPSELTFAYVMAGTTRGVMVAIVTMLAMSLFVTVDPQHWLFIVFHAVGASMMLSLLGLIGGIWADKFDHIAFVTNFVIMPLSFLSGTFYSTQRLPGIWYDISHANPFFYMIDGFRYGFINHADGNVWVGLAVVGGLNAFLWCVSLWMFRSGYKLKS